MKRMRISVLAGAAVLAGLAAGMAIAASGSPGQPNTSASSAAYSTPGYSWYRSMMTGNYGGTMMGGPSSGWMMSVAGFQWMTGAAGTPGWMRGGTLPGAMTGTDTDPGTVMGALFSDAPGPRVSPAIAQQLGGQIPAGASADRASGTITFTGRDVTLTVLASPSTTAGAFRIAGMTDPAITVPAGAHISIQLINADTVKAHGLVITAGAARSQMPMMNAVPAFAGAALWFLGNPTNSGMHTGTIAFIATTPGSYQYLCPVPGSARDGMAGTFTVR
jgi:sulfocyanin SoxE-like protein